MRDYKKIDSYLDELLCDIYPQPPDPIHTELTREVINAWVSKLHISNVLDIGCGEGFAQPLFESFGVRYYGVSLGKDWVTGTQSQHNIYREDFSFLSYSDSSFDLIFARHVLEHSPIPLLTLFEWHRVSRQYLCLISPKPSYWKYGGINHYFVLEKPQIEFLLIRSGWNIIWQDHSHEMEFRFMCVKVDRYGFENKLSEAVNRP